MRLQVASLADPLGEAAVPTGWPLAWPPPAEATTSPVDASPALGGGEQEDPVFGFNTNLQRTESPRHDVELHAFIPSSRAHDRPAP